MRRFNLSVSLFVLICCLSVFVMAACDLGLGDHSQDQTTLITITQPTQSPSTGVTGTPTPASGCLAPSVRVGPFGFDCPDGTTTPPNTSPNIPNKCTLVLTATPKYSTGDDVPAAVHGPNISWEVVSGPIVLSDYSGEPFNKLAKANSATATGNFTIRATVCGTSGTYSATLVP